MQAVRNHKNLILSIFLIPLESVMKAGLTGLFQESSTDWLVGYAQSIRRFQGNLALKSGCLCSYFIICL